MVMEPSTLVPDIVGENGYSVGIERCSTKPGKGGMKYPNNADEEAG